MAIIKPFKGFRPKPGLEKEIASHPYDVLSSDEARELVKENEHSFLHIVKPEIDLPCGTDIYSNVVYEKAKDSLNCFIDKGWLIQDESERLYIYKQNMDGHEQFGLVVAAACDDYDNGIIKKHEFTRPEKEDDRFSHVNITGANAGPVFLTYRTSTVVDELIRTVTNKQPPVYDFIADDGIGHTFWVIEDESVNSELVNAFSKVDYLYVADGHHRAASGSRARKVRAKENSNHTGAENYNFFLTVLFPSNQLKVLAYNRVVEDLAGNSSEDILKKLKAIYNFIEDGIKVPSKKGTVSVYLEKKWHLFELSKDKGGKESSVDGLDVALLQNRFLAPVLEIDDPRTSSRIRFVGGIRGTDELEKLVDSGVYQIAFSMFPTSVDEIMSVSDEDEVMPPKSTWFEPKLRSGLIVHKF